VRTVYLAFILIFFLCETQAQEKCATVPYNKQIMEKLGVPESTQQFEQWLQQKINQRKSNQKKGTENLKMFSASDATYKIPVVVHVIHMGEPVGMESNLSEARILSQLEALNKDFNRINEDKVKTPASFESVAGSLNIEFVLAKSAPNGQPTTGIVRVDGGKRKNAPQVSNRCWNVNTENSELKAKSYWPSEDYLNIWVSRLCNDYIGLAQYPVSDLEGLEGYKDGLALTDGVVIDYSAFGIGSEDPSYNLGRSTTHEVGHFLGLRHTWGDENNCTGSDYVSDTPNQAGSSLDYCPAPFTVKTDDCSTSAPGVMYQNYMDYTDDACMNLFTKGQVERMQVILENSPRRASLLNSAGLLLPSGLGEDLEIIAMNATPATCNPNSVIGITLKNVSPPGVVINSFKLNYKVNESGTITQEYNNLAVAPGETYALSLAITLTEETNSIFIGTHSPNNFADVNTTNNQALLYTVLRTSRVLIPVRENFDHETVSWASVNPTGGTTWEIVNTPNGFKKSVYFNGYNNPSLGEEGWLVSPLFDFSYSHKASLFFDLSYGFPYKPDKLKVLASTNCGESFDQVMLDISGTELSNYGGSSPNWFPSNSGDWRENGKQVNLNALAGEHNVILAIVAENQGGNNIFIDNLEIYPSEVRMPINNYSIYWVTQGTSLLANISFDLPAPQPASITVMDVTGKILAQTNLGMVQGQSFSIPVEKASPGLYLIRLQLSNRYHTTKLYLAP
jgi:hypothetical protein